ncbi:hypothetical protein VP168E361_P0057 [Vibrio phage 168E36-1]|nr:hypothetical protein VP168E361_P0057 [Vibrio phage 168E36-1]
MKTKPRQLRIEVDAGTMLSNLLEKMHNTGDKKTAEFVFDGNYLQRQKISATDIIEVAGMGEDPQTDTYQFNYIVTKPSDNDEIEQPVEKPPINKTISIKMSGVNDKTEYDAVSECFNGNNAYQHDGYWWSICKRNYVGGGITIFTLTNPCATITEWELRHKPELEVNNPRGLLTTEPVEPTPEPKQPDIVYIAGAISGDVVANRHRFAAAKHSIMASSTNTTVLNPAELPDGLTQTQYMSICLPMVMMSTSIFMLTGWEKSKGAVAEHALAEKLGIEINYQGQHDGKL